MTKSLRGFTIVELLVVISIIGILATITFMGFGRYQADTRDSARSGQATILAESLEKYYEQNGEYPGCPALTGTATTVTTSVLPGVEPQTLLTPQAPSGTTNSIQCADLTNISQPDTFAYVGDNSSTCLSGQACLTFQLKYKDEATGQIITINSRHNTSIAVSGAPTLSASADGTNGFTQINSSWTAVNSAISYDIVRATDSAFTANVVTQTTSATSFSTTGLSFNPAGGTYYFRVRANSVTSSGAWSSTVIASTWGLAAPTTTVSTSSSTVFLQSWNAVPHATSYTFQCSGDGVTWGTGCQGVTTATSYAYGGAAQGTKYYVRVQATNGSYIGLWSNITSTITTIDAPAAFPLWSTNLLPNWNYLNLGSGVSCPAGTSPSNDWYINGSYWMTGGVSQSYGLSWNQSVTASVASRCVTGAASSAFVWANNTASMSLPIPSVWAYLAAYRTAGWAATCPNWTTSSVYYFSVHGDGTVGYVQSGATQATSWDGTAYSWGNGNIRAAIVCSGPWGSYRVDSSPAPFGPGCVPTITVSQCTW